MVIRASSIGGIPFGDNSGRPANPGTGQPYFNGESQRLELYTGSTYGWQNIVAETPGVTGYTGTLYETSGGTITITGTNFASGATVSLIGSDGTEYNASSVTINNLTSVTAVFGPIAGDKEPYDIRVTNPSNLYGVYYDILTVNDRPVWQTAAGSLGSFQEQTSISVSVLATDEENNSVTYSLASGSSLPSGITLNSSTGVISGTLPDISANTTYTFTVNASDGLNSVTSRTFSITSQYVLPVEYLVVGGGGAGGDYFQGGGYNAAGGGGGAGGVLYSSSYNTFLNNTAISVGSAGVSTATSNTSGGYASNGGNSTFGLFTATGGGRGGSGNSSVSTNASVAGSGGSGGGGVRPDASSNYATAGTGISGQGNAGGNYQSGDGDGGGGGGQSAAGIVGGRGSQGGSGFTSSITGSSIVYAAGGGGGKGSSSESGYSWSGSGGSGVGGNGGTKQANSPGSNASSTSYGSGGGGAGSGINDTSVFSKGGNGAGGVVIIAYPNTYPTLNISAGLTYDQPVRSGYRVYRFTAGSGTVSIN
jgi:hypothetical protein